MGLTVHFPYSLPLKMAAHIRIRSMWKYAETAYHVTSCACPSYQWSRPQTSSGVYITSSVTKKIRFVSGIETGINNFHVDCPCSVEVQLCPALLQLWSQLGCTKMLCECFLITEKTLINFFTLCTDDCLLHNLLTTLQLLLPPWTRVPKQPHRDVTVSSAYHPDTPTLDVCLCQ